MSTHGEAAEQIVDMATNLTVKGVEVVTNIAGKGALSFATFMIAALKDQKRTKGKVRMRYFNGKPTQAFAIRSEDFPRFVKAARENDILYAAALNKRNAEGIVYVEVHQNDAARTSRITESFALSPEEIDKLREEILKSREQKSQNEDVKERTTPPAEKAAHTVDDATLDEMLGEPAPQQTAHKQPIDISENAPNPTMAGTDCEVSRRGKSNPSAPLSALSRDTAEEHTIERPSVREQIKEIKEERREKIEQQKSGPTKNRQTVHQHPERKKISKDKER